MENESLDGDLVLEETATHSLSRVAPEHDTLVLQNVAEREIDELDLARDIAGIQGIERIKSLIVAPSSRAKDLRFLKALPGLETMEVTGLQLRSLEGLEWFRQGRYLKVDTGRNRHRDIAAIGVTNIRRLFLHWAREEDLEAIGQCAALRELLLSNCPRLSLKEWERTPLELLSLFNGAIDELAGTAYIPTLRKLTLDGCRRLETFAGDNGNVTWMVVQRCNRLDFQTLTTFSSLEHLVITSISANVPLSAFSGVGQLRTLSFQQCKVRLDTVDVTGMMPELEELTITGLKKGQAAELSRANSGVRISHGFTSYLDGVPVND